MQVRKATCFETLKRQILSLELQPGAALEEAALSAEYEISRTPLREVLQKLAGLGYVVHERNRGAVVAPMTLEVMRSFFQTAPMIYAAVARLAAENATPGDVERLRDIQAQFRDAVERGVPGEMVVYNHRFHEAIGEIADNQYLKPSLDRLLIDHSRMSQTFYRPRFENEAERVNAACGQHDELIEAIASHEPARAVRITQDHWELSRNRIELYVRPDPLSDTMADPMTEKTSETEKASRDAV